MEDYTTSRSEYFREYFKMFPDLNPSIKYNNNSILFRFHRGGLIESLETIIEVSNRIELEHIICDVYGVGDISIKEYGYDDRIDWDTYIVCHNENAVGYLNSPL